MKLVTRIAILALLLPTSNLEAQEYNDEFCAVALAVLEQSAEHVEQTKTVLELVLSQPDVRLDDAIRARIYAYMDAETGFNNALKNVCEYCGRAENPPNE